MDENKIFDDNEQSQGWDITKPLFNQFFIIGPQEFKDKPKSLYNQNSHIDFTPTTLYQYPEKSEPKKYGDLIMPFGTKINDSQQLSTRDSKIEFSSQNEILNDVTFYKVDGNDPVFVYAIIFRATPFSLPAFLNPLLLDLLILFRDSKINTPVFKCAFVFETVHPFHSLFFRLLRTMIKFEFQVRNTKMNLKILNKGFVIPYNWNASEYWPCSTFFSRLDFLNSLYKTSLPVFGETIAIKFNDRIVPDFTWRMPERNVIAYSPAEVGYKEIMSWINLENYISLMEVTLLSYPIAVLGNNISDITKTVSFIPNIIMPFVWSNPVLSLAPKEQTADFLNAATPLIVGAFSEYADGQSIDKDYTLIIIENKEIAFFKDPPQIPGRKELLSALEKHFDTLKNHINFDTVKSIFKITQDHIYKFITKKMESCLEYKTIDGKSGTIFDQDKYFTLFSKDELDFITEFFDSQNFKTCVSKLCYINTSIRKGNDMSLEGLGGWSASVQQMLDEIDGIRKPIKRSPAQFLNQFDPYG